MDFQLSDDHRMLQDSLRGVLARHSGDGLAPALAELGIPEALLTEAEGGFDGSGAAVALIFEELGRAGAPSTPVAAMIGAAALAQAGHDAAVLAFADAEPGTRHDRGVAMRAEGECLTGRKTMVIGAEGAQGFLVTTADALWRVDRDAEGVEFRPYPLMDDQPGGDLILCDAPATRLGALSGHDGVLARAVLAHAAYGLGVITAAFDLTLDYLRQRKQFGQPLIAFQALAHRMADLAVEVEQARSAVVNLSGHLDAEPALRDRHLQACKVTVGRAARLLAEESVQLHGGIGMTEEYALGGIIRRLIAADTAMGDADYHLERFALAEPAFA
ncbi:pimeloyl-CoA dehydrogenase small subunit [Paracoccus aestuarii]|uniref:Pimeloyl-CoA dehydrogenase small subunit n=1 Tax=Paracoccus aestuarii TaxID=453842 RepID=A0A418ZU50_9RHOB|nr:acyl-CoA dehydrogenase family protein [Paracoccus aestuarii]RJL02896.1 pimeloyl-CoA dehydrogenase small subunit [Paracoccus aestuarii]WCQ98951.1 pimeloyl-CoA dehydrogenase small subunit [Paracoccus aestuarii]